ncbi:MAG: toxin-antitoxin system YwqK family antitoxin, partial [Bacteroidia bacterium]
MKKTFLILLIIKIACQANAQDYKLLIDDNGRQTNAFKATSYIVVKQLADTAWLMQQYDLDNAILQSSVFKDKNLQIPHGKYAYYRKLNFYNNKMMKDILKSDTANCIMTEGEFRDGKKEGRWTDYFIGGKKREVATYKDGLLNGPYRSYSDDHSTIALSGNYVDGKRDGEWLMFGMGGKLIETDKYRNGKVYNKKISPGPYNAPKPPSEFENYVSDAIQKAISVYNIGNTSFDHSFILTVTTGGNIIEPHVAQPGHDDDPFTRILVEIIRNSPKWKPANTGDDTKPVE